MACRSNMPGRQRPWPGWEALQTHMQRKPGQRPPVGRCRCTCNAKQDGAHLWGCDAALLTACSTCSSRSAAATAAAASSSSRSRSLPRMTAVSFSCLRVGGWVGVKTSVCVCVVGGGLGWGCKACRMAVSFSCLQGRVGWGWGWGMV